MATTDKNNQTKGVPTGEILRIAEVRDDMVIMQDGTLRAVLAVSSTNFDLKNEDEQNGIIYAYQRFLNSLDFPIQILMQSRKLNIGDYISRLQMQTQRLDNELLRMQSTYYIDFISELVNDANIMSKNFYIVVPLAQNVQPDAPGFLTRIFGGGATAQANKKMENIKKYREQLQQRVDSIVSNLSGMGLRVVRLDTGALIELYYNSYNFEAAPTLNSESLGDIKVVDKPQ